LPFDAAIDKKNPAIQESCASDFDYINGLEQQQEIIDDERIEEVNNNWSIDKNGKNDGENGNNSDSSSNQNAISIDSTCHCISGEGGAFERSAIVNRM
jgi:hypothetical protein